MSKTKDPAIKLFGKTIQMGSKSNEGTVIASTVEPSVAVAADVDDVGCDCEFTGSDQNKNRGDETATIEPVDTKQEGEPSSSSLLDESKAQASPSTITENPKTFSNDKECSSNDHSKKDEYQSDQTSSITNSEDQTPPKKPDKILACPRCNSMDTKFCYFNNYNVNQPRHFCKNCQRYWTVGGTMRSVPVGAGRRKSKNSLTPQHQHLLIPEASDGLIHHAVRPKGPVFAFKQDSSLSDHSKPHNFPTNGFIRLENRKENLSSNVEKGSYQGVLPPQVSCFPYTWNPIPWQQPGFPLSFYSITTPQWASNSTGTWNLQWLPNPPSINPSDQSSTCSSPNPPSLRKHSRDGTMLVSSNPNKEPLEEKNPEHSRVVMPKTLRVDDPSEVAKSSIWTTLGMKNRDVGSSSGRLVGFFGGLQQAKGIEHGIGRSNFSAEGSSNVLQANPAAFSRSLSFHEIAQ